MQQQRGKIIDSRSPFWLPAPSYYVLSVAMAVGLFFLMWGILNEGKEQTPWIIGAAGAGFVLAAAIFLREVILRNARNRFLATQRRLDKSLRGVANRVANDRSPAKLTLERNAAVLAEIRQKSAAAKVLGKFSAGHMEVFQLCEEYMRTVAGELPNIGIGSPRIAALRKGNNTAGEYHRYHLLQWAEIEARTLTQEANNRAKAKEKLETTQKAIGAVEFGLKYYPDEASLLDSLKVLEDFIISIKVSNAVEKAERAYFKGNVKQAVSLYQDALFDLSRGAGSREREIAAERIESELSKIRQIEGNK
ncbi:MAG: hypothetical protein WKF92_00460 [Pyrinomonadaceae bacterium]